jgi:hypothetical protein
MGESGRFAVAVSNIVHAFIVFGRQPGFALAGRLGWNRMETSAEKIFTSPIRGPEEPTVFLECGESGGDRSLRPNLLNGVLIDGLAHQTYEGYQVFDVTTLGNALA